MLPSDRTEDSKNVEKRESGERTLTSRKESPADLENDKLDGPASV